MESTDFDAFGERLTVLGEIFDAKLSPAKMALYFETLRDLALPTVVNALTVAAKTCKFFPKPVELRELAIGNGDDIAEQAWLALRKAMSTVGMYASVVFDDAALGDTVLSMFGSWPAACAQDLSPEMWANTRKTFGRVYRVCRDRHVDGPRYLVGECERSNAGHDDWLRYVEVKRLARSGQVHKPSLSEAAELRATCQLAAAQQPVFAAVPESQTNFNEISGGETNV